LICRDSWVYSLQRPLGDPTGRAVASRPELTMQDSVSVDAVQGSVHV
jgi:hypothetical protein